MQVKSAARDVDGSAASESAKDLFEGVSLVLPTGVVCLSSPGGVLGTIFPASSRVGVASSSLVRSIAPSSVGCGGALLMVEIACGGDKESCCCPKRGWGSAEPVALSVVVEDGSGSASGGAVCLVGVRDLALLIGVLTGVEGVGNPQPVLCMFACL